MIKNRKLNRLKDYNYSREGYYFVTVCTKDRQEWFGKIKNSTMKINECGKIAHEYWLAIPCHYKNVALDQFVIMPNHIHGIIIIVGTEQCSVPTKRSVSLSQIIKSFKDMTTKQVRSRCGIYFAWQRSFHDHIIRNDQELTRIREYIVNNSLKWDKDVENLYSGIGSKFPLTPPE